MASAVPYTKSATSTHLCVYSDLIVLFTLFSSAYFINIPLPEHQRSVHWGPCVKLCMCWYIVHNM